MLSATEIFAELAGQMVGGWLLQEPLGHGKSGAVHRGTKDSETAAVKIYDPSILSRFGENEQIRRINLQLDLVGKKVHPNLIKILGGGKCDVTGLWFLVMEYRREPTLEEALRKLPRHRIRPIIAQIAAAAKALESRGLAHRDIKPSNVLISRDYRHATLLDLGVLKPITAELDYTDADRKIFVGTTRYSPPELLTRTEEPTMQGWAAVTFYQLGALLYSAVSRNRMFPDIDDEPYTKLTNAVQHKQVKVSRKDHNEIGDDSLVDLITRCLEKDWEQRIQQVSWQDFECKRQSLVPTVILLYAGGTIGSTAGAHGDDRQLRRVETRHSRLLHEITQRIKLNYKQIVLPSAGAPFDLQWEILPLDRQILSENAQPETWNAIASAIAQVCEKYMDVPRRLHELDASERATSPEVKSLYNAEVAAMRQEGLEHPTLKAFVSDLCSRYIAGIIVLHGTDTLAYTASALALSLKHLPCPILLTGSNQPPEEKSITERDIIQSKSDAWKNLLTSIYFLHCLGHRFTEVFVCFNETILQAINTRKAPLQRMPHKPEPEQSPTEEPYTFRTIFLPKQYMFRLVDGLFCNNYYPVTRALTYSVLSQQSGSDYRHVREAIYGGEAPLQRLHFVNECVSLHKVSPSSVFVPRARFNRNLRVILLEGYDSGTFPSERHHPFTRQLAAWLKAALPIVLVTRYGLVPSGAHYEVEKIDGQALPIMRLYSIIAETAVPLLSIVAGAIPDDDWSPSGLSGEALLSLRHDLLRRGLISFVDPQHGLLRTSLGDIIDVREQRERISGLIAREEKTQEVLTEKLFAEAESRIRRIASRGHAARSAQEGTEGDRDNRSGDGAPGSGEDGFPPSVTYPREFFIWHILEICRPYQVAGVGPDAYKTLNDSGFFWGGRQYQLLSRSRPSRPWKEGILFDEQDEKSRAELLAHSNWITKSMIDLLTAGGIADIETDGWSHSRVTDDSGNDTAWLMKLEARLVRRHTMLRDDELYSVQQLDGREEDYFGRLREGTPLDSEDAEHRRELEDTLWRLTSDTWRMRVSALDWFLLGVLKAIACRVLRELVLDEWVKNCDQDLPRHIKALRDSVGMKLLQADKDALRVVISYRSRPLYLPIQDGAVRLASTR